MFRMKRLLLCLLLSFALLLTACGAPAPAEPEVPEAPAPIETATPEPEPEPELAPESNLVGIAMPTVDLYRWKHEGELMKEQLETLGYAVDLEFARNDAALQIEQIEDMIANGVKVLIVCAIDSESLGNVLDTAKEASIRVISYDRLILGTDVVSYYCTFDNPAVGQAQGQYIVDALDLEHADGKTYNLELFSGDSGDSNAYIFYYWTMQVLQPYIDNGTLIVRSGQTEMIDAATEYWAVDKARERMERILAEFYSGGEPLDAVMCSNDSTAQGVAEALEAGYRGDVYPVITGQDCDIVSVKNLLAGKQTMSAFKDTRDLAAAAVEMADAILKGQEPPVNDREMYDNGTGIIPSYLIPPRVVTTDNLKELLIDSGYYTPEQIGIDLLTEAGIEIP